METQLRKEYPVREIYVRGRYIQCQILNGDWEGEPPKYLICNPLDNEFREMFLAKQGRGTWMWVDLREVPEIPTKGRPFERRSLKAARL